MRARWLPVNSDIGGSAAPCLLECAGERAHVDEAFCAGPEIPGLRIVACRWAQQPRTKIEVACQRLKHMLPWPDARRIANGGRRACQRCPHQVGQKPVWEQSPPPMTLPARTVASWHSPSAGKFESAETPPPPVQRSLWKRCRGAPRPSGGFAVGGVPFAIFIALVAGYYDHAACASPEARPVQHHSRCRLRCWW